MIRKKKDQEGPVIIDLTGEDGNAFALLGYAQRFAKDLNIDSKPIIDQMMEGDYENLLEVFDRYFGNYVILER